MIGRMREHRERMIYLLRSAENIDLLEIDYAQLLGSPNESLSRIMDFAGVDAAALQKMRSVIDPQLRHFTSEKRVESIATVD